MQVERCKLCSRQRPFLFSSPSASVFHFPGTRLFAASSAHDRQEHRWLLVHTIVSTFHPSIKPTQSPGIKVEGGSRRKFDFPRESITLSAMGPWPDDQSVQ